MLTCLSAAAVAVLVLEGLGRPLPAVPGVLSTTLPTADGMQVRSRHTVTLVVERKGEASTGGPSWTTHSRSTCGLWQAYEKAKQRQDGLYKYHCLAGELTSMGEIPW